MKLFYLLITVTGLFAGLSAADPLESYRKKAENIRYGSKEDLALGEELCKVFSELGKKRKMVVKHPLFISQFVPHRVGHLSFTDTIWNDRQLSCDRRLWESPKSDFQYSAVLKNFQEMKDAGYDGATAWTYPGYRRAWIYYLKAAQTAGDFKMLPGATPGFREYSVFEKPLLDDMVNHPAMLRIDGKPVIRSYSTDIKNDLPQIRSFLENIIRGTGGKDVMYMTELFMVRALKQAAVQPKYTDQIVWYWKTGKVSGKALLLEYDYLVDHLNLPGSGGLCYGPYMTDQALKFPYKFYDKIVLPLFQAVLARPEFNGKKLFTLNFKCGYTHSAGSQTLSRDGTKTLRKNLELFLKFKPDVLIGSEWDELNEDTCLGATVVRPMSSPRITRYYSAVSRGRTPEPLPGDDISLPNLIVSQRRELVLGSEFELELLNVPDSGKNETYKVDLQILDRDGKTVCSRKGLAFESGKMMDHTIRLNTADFTLAGTLNVRLQIHTGKGIRRIDSGLPFTVLRPAVCDNHTWFCTPLRNLMQPQKEHIRYTRLSTGEIKVEAQLSFKQQLNSVELLENAYTVAAFDPNDEFALADCRNQLFLVMTLDLKKKNSRITLDLNVPSGMAFQIPSDPRKTAVRKKFPVEMMVYNKFNRQYFAVDKTLLADAVLTVSGSDVKWQQKLKDVKPGDVVSITTKSGKIITLQASPVPLRMALPMKDGNVRWQTVVPETLPEAAMVVRAVSQCGKVWYGKGFVPAEKPGAEEKQLRLAGHNEYRKWQYFTLPESRVPVIDYLFDPAGGSTLKCKAGRDYYAQLGGNAQFASRSNGTRTEENAGISRSCFANIVKPSAVSTPQWKQENWRHYLHFDGKSGNFIMLPRTAIPQYSGFHITMEIRPRKLTGTQIVWSQYNTYQTGLELTISSNGRCRLSSIQRRPHDLFSPYLNHKQVVNNQQLLANQWNKIEIIYDGKTLKLGVNGEFRSVPADGVSRWMSISCFGGWEKKMFYGDLRKFVITPALPGSK